VTRKSRPDYAGPRGRLRSVDQLAKLDPKKWVVQRKLDGCYAHVHTDAHGSIFAVTSRTGRELQSDLTGTNLHVPHAEIAGELAGHTEAGLRRRETLGYDEFSAFDLVALDGRSLAHEPYRVRRDQLLRARGHSQFRSAQRATFDDDLGRAHHYDGPLRGKYAKRIPKGWGRVPVVQNHPLSQAEELYEQAQSPISDFASEGIVIANLDAPLGKRRSKLKLKPADGLDVTVISVEPKRLIVHWSNADQYFVVGRAGHDVQRGQTIEVLHEGFYDDGIPKFPRLHRIRHDLL